MQTYKSKVFYHRDELTEWLNTNKPYIVNITWIGNCWVLFYFN